MLESSRWWHMWAHSTSQLASAMIGLASAVTVVQQQQEVRAHRCWEGCLLAFTMQPCHKEHLLAHPRCPCSKPHVHMPIQLALLLRTHHVHATCNRRSTASGCATPPTS